MVFCRGVGIVLAVDVEGGGEGAIAAVGRDGNGSTNKVACVDVVHLCTSVCQEVYVKRQLRAACWGRAGRSELAGYN